MIEALVPLDISTTAVYENNVDDRDLNLVQEENAKVPPWVIRVGADGTNWIRTKHYCVVLVMIRHANLWSYRCTQQGSASL